MSWRELSHWKKAANPAHDAVVPSTCMSPLLPGEAEFLLYQSDDGQTRVEVRFDSETAWLSLGQMAELF
jgi:hypothetical protein